MPQQLYSSTLPNMSAQTTTQLFINKKNVKLTARYILGIYGLLKKQEKVNQCSCIRALQLNMVAPSLQSTI